MGETDGRIYAVQRINEYGVHEGTFIRTRT